MQNIISERERKWSGSY